ncbi:MAG: hypothetical protein GWN07_32975, partial [Actinobacteria bacterium]|nr:hypothetical protein [Actinomycetota bacterium]NIS35589.1 hypothetical protein [Actinomycetota bacterium]NIU70247.1 hypothetical protein [Actinomycetota bacterium]NIV89928.1 hypothetical protein [Actinomycetota bacterium]NIW32132.1 hypothetical protein [Actinomycetota bacterium]
MGYAEDATDCDDSVASVNPGNRELCDAEMVDEDCDGTANPAELCSCSAGDSRPCNLEGACAAGTEECLDGSWGACSIAPITEICNGVDDDCDGATDEGLTVTCFADGDNDGYAEAGAAESQRCPDSSRGDVGSCPSFTTNRQPFGEDIDCNDDLSSRAPGAT